MKTVKAPIAVFAAAAIVGACAQDAGQKEQAGTIIGGVVGGVIGSNVGEGDGRTAATLAGILIGAIIGREIGRDMDENDRRMAESTAQDTLENNRTGQTSTWSNPDSGHSGTVTPTRTYRTDGRDCREYETTVYIDGKRETAYGTACRQPDGSWKLVE